MSGKKATFATVEQFSKTLVWVFLNLLSCDGQITEIWSIVLHLEPSSTAFKDNSLIERFCIL